MYLEKLFSVKRCTRFHFLSWHCFHSGNSCTSLKSITFFIFLGQLFQSSCYVYLVAHGKPTRITDMIFAVVCLSLYFLCVKANAWKLLFLCFFIFNFMVTLRGICFFWKAGSFPFGSNVLFTSQ